MELTMSKFIVMRGLPGSGKSTLARSLFENSEYLQAYWLSTDFGFHGNGRLFYFSNDDGRISGPNGQYITIDEFLKTPYKFNPRYLGRNHSSTFCHFCKLISDSFLKNENSLFILDNTNTQYREFMLYVEVARKLGVEIELVYPETDWAFDVEKCSELNSHGVPKDVIQKMKDRFEWIQP